MSEKRFASISYIDCIKFKNLYEGIIVRESDIKRRELIAKCFNDRPVSFITISDKYFLSDTYGDTINQTHYDNRIAFNTILPDISNKFGIEYKQDDFDVLTLRDRTFKYPLYYQQPKNDGEYRLISLDVDYRFSITGSHQCVLRSNPEQNTTPYHKMFSSTHRSCFIENLTANTGRRLLYIGDSLAGQFVPALIQYFDNILCLDINHQPKMPYDDYVKYVLPYNPTHTLLLHHISNLEVVGRRLNVI